jgi:hypothetical protein
MLKMSKNISEGFITKVLVEKLERIKKRIEKIERN